MLKKYILGIMLAAGLLAGCKTGAEQPPEEEVRSKVLGEYCSEDFRYRLKLKEDGRYEGTRNKKSAFATGILKEKCEGAFTLRYDEEKQAWLLELAKSDDNSNPFVSCGAASQVLWEAEKGYVIGDSVVTLEEPFDQTKVTDCGGA